MADIKNVSRTIYIYIYKILSIEYIRHRIFVNTENLYIFNVQKYIDFI